MFWDKIGLKVCRGFIQTQREVHPGHIDLFLLLSRGSCCMVSSLQWRSRSSVLCAILRSSFEAEESQILHFVPFSSSLRDWTGSSTIIVFLRNVGLYIYFSVVRIIHGMFVCLPHAPSLKWEPPLSHSQFGHCSHLLWHVCVGSVSI